MVDDEIEGRIEGYQLESGTAGSALSSSEQECADRVFKETKIPVLSVCLSCVFSGLIVASKNPAVEGFLTGMMQHLRPHLAPLQHLRGQFARCLSAAWWRHYRHAPWSS
ncbi:hypothetical protein XANCAGTX0491_000732 [Xanthoria calcicola]